MRAADDFDAIRSRLNEMKVERERNTSQVCRHCGQAYLRIHAESCQYSGVVVESELAQ